MRQKMFEIDIERKSQNPYMIFMGQKQHGDEVVLKAQEFIENNPTATFTVDELCDKFGVGRRTFERRFKKCTHCSVIEYLQKVRIEASKKELEASRKSIDEIILEVGYTDTQTFRDIFRRVTGTTPIEYKQRYSKP